MSKAKLNIHRNSPPSASTSTSSSSTPHFSEPTFINTNKSGGLVNRTPQIRNSRALGLRCGQTATDPQGRIPHQKQKTAKLGRNNRGSGLVSTPNPHATPSDSWWCTAPPIWPPLSHERARVLWSIPIIVLSKRISIRSLFFFISSLSAPRHIACGVFFFYLYPHKLFWMKGRCFIYIYIAIISSARGLRTLKKPHQFLYEILNNVVRFFSKAVVKAHSSYDSSAPRLLMSHETHPSIRMQSLAELLSGMNDVCGCSSSRNVPDTRT